MGLVCRNLFPCSRQGDEMADFATTEAESEQAESEAAGHDQVPAAKQQRLSSEKEKDNKEKEPAKSSKAKAAAAAHGQSQGDIASMFSSMSIGSGSGIGKASQGKPSTRASSTANKEINKSDACATEAAEMLQSFDDAGEIFCISEKKLEDLITKVKGRVILQFYSVQLLQGLQDLHCFHFTLTFLGISRFSINN